MNKKNYELWNNITFKTTSYRKNFDILYEHENFITEHEGIVSKTQIKERKLPIQLGEFQFSVWNLGLAKEFNVNLLEQLEEHTFENTYEELLYLLQNNILSFNETNKLIILHTLLIHPKYRKMGVTEEFIEFLHRDFSYGNNNHLIALVKPIQNNLIDYDYFWNRKRVKIKNFEDSTHENVSAKEYYQLNNLIDNDDTEINEYKLFSVATKCGFKRIGESHLFVFNPEKIMERLKEKRVFMEDFDNIDELY